MQLLEHESKALCAARGVPVPAGGLARTPEEAQRVADGLGENVAVKAQVPIGGRGKAGGIRLVAAGEAAEAARDLLGADVRGYPVRTVLVEEALPAGTELYVGIAVDPRARRPLLLVSAAGGVDVEEDTDAVARVPWTLRDGLRPTHVRRAAEAAGLDPGAAGAIVPIAGALAALFAEERAQSVEINPLIDLGGGRFVAADARVVPDSALAADTATADRPSRALGFDYVVLDPEGDVGLITTGAGASMLVIDLMTRAGLHPIDFCDVRTGSLRGDPTRLVYVLDDLRDRPNLACIGVNVFAGITDLREVAELLLVALEQRDPGVPLVVRLEGRDAEAARRELRDHGIAVVESPEELVAATLAIVKSSDRERVA